MSLRLFSMDVSITDDAAEIEAVLTPPKYHEGKHAKSPILVDEDSGLGMDTDEVSARLSISYL